MKIVTFWQLKVSDGILNNFVWQFSITKTYLFKIKMNYKNHIIHVNYRNIFNMYYHTRKEKR